MSERKIKVSDDRCSDVNVFLKDGEVWAEQPQDIFIMSPAQSRLVAAALIKAADKAEGTGE
jgi:hypothetical protein